MGTNGAHEDSHATPHTAKADSHTNDPRHAITNSDTTLNWLDESENRQPHSITTSDFTGIGDDDDGNFIIKDTRARRRRREHKRGHANHSAHPIRRRLFHTIIAIILILAMLAIGLYAFDVFSVRQAADKRAQEANPNSSSNITMRPAPTPSGSTFSDVAVGTYHAVALTGDGKAWSWGLNLKGELGNGTTQDTTTPVKADAPSGITFTQISTGNWHTLALDSDGHIWAWGLNNAGQLGDGTTTDRHKPVRVKTPSSLTFTQISASYKQSLALDSNGNAWGWGYNGEGELGNGTITNSLRPQQVTMPAHGKFTQIRAGLYHTLALNDTGDIYAWGYNSDGELGNDGTADSTVPFKVRTQEQTIFMQVDAGGMHSLALDSKGQVWSWGYNDFGQLGDGTTSIEISPTKVHMPANTVFSEVHAGTNNSFALSRDGAAWSWGKNNAGALGDGSGKNQDSPVQVRMPSHSAFSDMAAGDTYALAIDQNGTTWSWGTLQQQGSNGWNQTRSGAR